ncbi:MAG: hypothetical protein HY954_00510 [Deltaproteobacteria bacterium]|nr:hypothetical protein [Deltaproteobacteria bacterium]
MKVRQGLQKFIFTQTPLELKLKVAARAYTDETLAPEDEATLLFIYSHDRDPAVASSARKSFEEYPVPLILEALEKKLDPLVIKKFLEIHKDNEAVFIMAYLNPWVDDDTLKILAESGPEEVIAFLSEEKERFFDKPFLLESLKKNPLAPYILINGIEAMLRAEKVLDTKASAARGPRFKERDPEALKVPKELIDERKVDEQNIFKIVQSMSMAQKVKLALSGNKSARELLIKDSNKMIATAVLKNPRITEDEVLRLTITRGTPEDLLRQVAKNKEWVKNYNVKLGVVTNPKTPLTISVKLLDHLYEKDLTKLSKSKNIPSVLASTARRKLETKKK